MGDGRACKWVGGKKRKKEKEKVIALGLGFGQKMEMENGPSWVEIGPRLKEMGLGIAMDGMGNGCVIPVVLLLGSTSNFKYHSEFWI